MFKYKFDVREHFDVQCIRTLFSFSHIIRGVPRHASQVSLRAFGMLKKLTLIKSKEKVAQLDMFQVKELKKI